MKVFIVSEAGSVADVTLHTSCSMADHSALKVSQPGDWRCSECGQGYKLGRAIKVASLCTEQ